VQSSSWPSGHSVKHLTLAVNPVDPLVLRAPDVQGGFVFEMTKSCKAGFGGDWPSLHPALVIARALEPFKHPD
jgi:hypothetical protein